VCDARLESVVSYRFSFAIQLQMSVKSDAWIAKLAYRRPENVAINPSGSAV
jgi:hypothetical protein